MLYAALLLLIITFELARWLSFWWRAKKKVRKRLESYCGQCSKLVDNLGGNNLWDFICVPRLNALVSLDALITIIFIRMCSLLLMWMRKAEGKKKKMWENGVRKIISIHPLVYRSPRDFVYLPSFFSLRKSSKKKSAFLIERTHKENEKENSKDFHSIFLLFFPFSPTKFYCFHRWVEPCCSFFLLFLKLFYRTFVLRRKSFYHFSYEMCTERKKHSWTDKKFIRSCLLFQQTSKKNLNIFVIRKFLTIFPLRAFQLKQ